MNTYIKILLSNYDKNISCKRIFSGNIENSDIFIVFLHEGLGSISSWKNFPETLCNLTNVNGLIYDRDGFGNSDVIFQEYNSDFFEKQVEILNSILLELNISKCILVGHSDGGTIALLFAEKYPEKVLGLISIAGHILSEEKIYESLKILDKEKIINKIQKYHYDVEFVFNRWYNFWIKSLHENWNIIEKIEKINTPKLIIQGDKDEYSTELQYSPFYSITNCQVAIIENCGHIPHITNKTEFVMLCKKFISSI